jgi:hypothetical protein
MGSVSSQIIKPVSEKISRPIVQSIQKKSSSSPQVTKMELKEDDPPVQISTQPESPTEPLSTYNSEEPTTPTGDYNQPEVPNDEKFFRSDNPLMYVAGVGVIGVGGTMIYFASE